MVQQKLCSLLKNDNHKNFLIYGIGQAFNLLSPLIVAPLIVSVCKEEGLGKVGLGFVLSLFLILIVDYAFDVKGTKLVAENRFNNTALQKILCTTIFTKIALFLISLLVALVLIFCIPFFKQESNLFLFSITMVFAQVFNPVWFLQGLENFKLLSILNICSKSTYVALVFWFIVSKKDYIFVNFFLGSSAFVFNIIGLGIIKYKYRFKIIKPSFFEVKTILKNDFSFCVSQLFLSVRQISPLVLTSYFLGFAVAGQYKILEQIITLFRTFIQVFLKFFYPRVCFLFKSNPAQSSMFWKKYTTFNVGLVTSALILIFIVSDSTLRFFHLSEISIKELSLLFKVSLLISFLMSISLPLEQLMLITEKNKQYIKITFIVTITNTILILVLIKPFELNGIIAALITAELLFIFSYFYNSFLILNDRK